MLSIAAALARFSLSGCAIRVDSGTEVLTWRYIEQLHVH